jgi:dienelactone hydrolase
MRSVVLAGALLSFAPALAAADDAAPTAEKGTVHFTPADDQKEVPKLYRLEPRSFDYQMKWMYNLPGYDIGVYDLRFPSAIESTVPENNTVYAEYYRPEGAGPFPCVIVLDITGGDQSLSRVMCTHLSRHGIGGLFVQMAYYGPRRPPGSNLRLVSPDFMRTSAAIRQTVLDLRLATAWMESRPEIDAKRLGILGTSLGSFMASLTAEMEPRLGRVALMLGGGGLVDGYYDDPRAADYRRVFELLGGSKERLAKLIAPYDPITCAANLKSHKLLMLEAEHDEIVPPKMGENLWHAAGEQEIHWYNSGHYTSVFYLADGLEHVVKHFGAD